MTPFAPNNPEASIENLLDTHGIAAVMEALRSNCKRRSGRVIRTDPTSARLWERRALLIGGIVSAMHGEAVTKQASGRVRDDCFTQMGDTAPHILPGAICRVIEQGGRVDGVEYRRESVRVMDDNLEIADQPGEVNPDVGPLSIR